MKYFIFTLGLAILLIPHFLLSQVQKKKTSNQGIGYLEYLPESYSESGTALPCIIFLHGSGERGNGTTAIDKVKRHGPPKLVENGHSMCFQIDGNTECFVVISPQTNRWAWQPFEYIPFTDYIIDNYNVDPNRIYLTGLSMGGSGVWMNAYDDLNDPSRFAAIAPIAGYANENKACAIVERDIPVWAFHGLSDNAVNPWGQIKMIDAIKDCNPNQEIILTLYDGVGHNSWSRAYDATNKYHTPNLYEWFLKQNKNNESNPDINKPSLLTITNKSKNSLTLEWQDNSNNETKFIIEYKVEGETNFKVLSEVPANITQYILTDLICNTNYIIRIKAVGNNGEFSYSDAITDNTLSFSPPEIVVTGDLSFCVGDSVKLSVNENFADYKWSNGHTTKDILIKESGTYTVSVFQDGCWSLPSNQIIVNVNELPPKPQLSGNNNLELCDYKPVKLSIENDWEAYEWNTGGNSPSIEVNKIGKYAAKVMRNGCWSPISDSIEVKNAEIPAQPVIIYPDANEICKGMEKTLSTSKNYSYYEWSSGENSKSIKITSSGNYYVKVGHCQDLMSTNSDPIEINFKELTTKPTIENASGKTTFCPGETISLSGPEGYEKYLWSNNQTSQNTVVNESENIYLRIKSNGKCWSPPSSSIMINQVAAPTKPEVVYNSSLTLCENRTVVLSTKEVYQQYLWSDNSSTRSINVNVPEVFKVKVKNDHCWSQYSDEVRIRNPQTPPTPTLSFDQINELCTGDQINLSAPAGWENYKWSNGAISKDILVENSGNYSVQVSDCDNLWSESSNTISLEFLPVSPKPSITVEGKENICPEEATELIGPTSFDFYEWSNGSNGQSIVASKSGQYSLKVKKEGYCWSISSDEVLITAAPVPEKPFIEANNDLILCENESITLSTAQEYKEYYWTNNQNSSSIEVYNPGSFSVKGSNSFGCWSEFSDIINITKKRAPSRPQIINHGPFTFCTGDSLLLSINQQYNYYQWNTEETTKQIIVKDSGSYSVKVAHCLDDWSVSSREVNIKVEQTPHNISIYKSGDSLLTVRNEKFKYQWHLNNTAILGATKYFIIPVEKGNYAVKVSSNLGCSTISKDVIYADKKDDMVVYKNPTETGHFKIRITNKNITEGHVEVLNFNSKIVEKYNFKNLHDGNIPFDFNLEGYNRGIYVVRLIANNKSFYKTLIYR